LLDAATWRGCIFLGTRCEGGNVILEVRDNGIGMTDEVRARCRHPHFSTKRDNALHESNSTGMGLGLSFVAVILEHHHAHMEIESQRLEGSVFRVRFAKAPDSTENPADGE
jgi:signal transduction histidine kinase